MSHTRKVALLLVLEKGGITSVDIKRKILEKVYPPWKTIKAWLKKHDVPLENLPEHFTEFDGPDAIANAEWGWEVLDYEYGFEWPERHALITMAYALDFAYADLGRYSESSPRRFASMNIPRGWNFDPDRVLVAIEICAYCRRKVRKDAVFTAMSSHYCYPCTLTMRERGYFDYHDVEDNWYELDGDKEARVEEAKSLRSKHDQYLEDHLNDYGFVKGTHDNDDDGVVSSESERDSDDDTGSDRMDEFYGMPD